MNIPHNIEAERALLHQLIFERGQNISQVLAMGIDPGCFHDPKHSAIFEAIESIHREGRNPDMISVSEWLASSRHNRKARKDSLVEDSLAHHDPLDTLPLISNLSSSSLRL